MDENKKTVTTKLGEESTHPAYGMLSFRHRQGTKTNMFGSSIEHNDFISMTLYHGKVTRGLNTDWYHGDKIIAEVEMSYSQFAEAITSMNMGSGVPCTIRWTEKDGRIPECDFVNKRHQFEDEIKERLDTATSTSKALIDEITELFNTKKTISKADKTEILKKLNKIYSEINANMNYTYQMFNEQMDKTVSEAKGEIEAFCQNKINSIAQSTLMENHESFTKLENPIDLSNIK